MTAAGSTAPTPTSSASVEASGSTRTALIIDGSYALIGARNLGGRIDYIKLRGALEEQATTQFGDCWFFDQNPAAQLNPTLTAEYHMLKFAPPVGPQFQVSLFPMKKYSCHCRNCGNNFTQNVQKGVDNGIATKILSLAYENICDRFILFAGDGDFYSSLSQVRNVLRKDIWVIGYRGTVSGDLQQLASRVIWLNDLWAEVKSIRVNSTSRERGRRDESHHNRGVGPTQSTNDALLVMDNNEEIGDRQVVIAPIGSDTANNSLRGRSRGRGGRFNGRGRGRGRNGRRSRSRSRSRSRERPRVQQARAEFATPIPVPNDVSTMTSALAAAEIRPPNEGKRAGGRNGKKRRRNDNNERGQQKRGGRCNKRVAAEVPVFALSDVSGSEEEIDHPFPLVLPVPLRPATAAPVMTALGPDADMGLFGSRDQVINLASDTESE